MTEQGVVTQQGDDDRANGRRQSRGRSQGKGAMTEQRDDTRSALDFPVPVDTILNRAELNVYIALAHD